MEDISDVINEMHLPYGTIPSPGELERGGRRHTTPCQIAKLGATRPVNPLQFVVLYLSQIPLFGAPIGEPMAGNPGPATINVSRRSRGGPHDRRDRAEDGGRRRQDSRAGRVGGHEQTQTGKAGERQQDMLIIELFLTVPAAAPALRRRKTAARHPKPQGGREASWRRRSASGSSRRRCVATEKSERKRENLLVTYVTRSDRLTPRIFQNMFLTLVSLSCETRSTIYSQGWESEIYTPKKTPNPTPSTPDSADPRTQHLATLSVQIVGQIPENIPENAAIWELLGVCSQLRPPPKCV